MWIYCPYIVKNGVYVYPKNSKVFRFWVDDDQKKDATGNDQKKDA